VEDGYFAHAIPGQIGSPRTRPGWEASITATGADGTTYTLDIPANSLVTMNTIGNAGGVGTTGTRRRRESNGGDGPIRT